MKQFLTACLTLFVSLISLSLYAQTITGRVLDASTQIPVADVRLVLPPSGISTRSAADGQFAFSESSVGESDTLLQVQHPGYEARQISLRGRSFPVTIFLSPTLIDLDSVLIVAGETEQRLRDQAGSVALIPRQALERDNQLSLAPALNRVPGVLMQQGALNTARISIRGIGARNLFGTAKIRAYYEDIPLTDGEGGTSLEDLDLSLAQRVEVLRGPTSSIYGAGLGGTIRISAPQEYWQGQRVQLGAQLGAFGTRRFTGRVQTSTENGSYQLLLHNTHSDGFRDNSTYDRAGATATARWTIGSKSQIFWLGQFVRLKAFIPSSIDSADFAEDPSQAAVTWQQSEGFESYDRAYSGLSWRYRYSDHWEHWISVFGGFRDAYEPRPFDILRENSLQTGMRARWLYRRAKWQLTAGTEVFSERYWWETYENIGGLGDRGAIESDNREDRRYGNAFIQLRREWTEHWIWEAGANLNLTQYQFQDFFFADSVDLSGDYAYPPTLSPRMALLYRQQAFTLRAQLSHGFSPPTLAETLTPDGQINPDIRPEQGWNLELGARANLLVDKLWLDATVYRMWVQDLLVARRVGNDQFVGVNAGETRHDGFELGLRYRPGGGLLLWGNYASQRFRFVTFEDEGNDYSGNAVTGVPPHQLSAGLDWDLPAGFLFRLNAQYVDEMPLRDDNSVYSESYWVANAQVSWQQQMGQGRNAFPLELFAGVQNLADATYASMVLVNAGSFGGRAPRYYYPGNPREWYAGVRISWERR